MSAAPVVAHVAPNGRLGVPMLAALTQAIKDGEIAALKVVSSKETEHTKNATSASEKISVCVVDYSNKEAVTRALAAVDVLISTFGGFGPQIPLEQILVEAAVEAGVKVYINSDFGSDYDTGTFGASFWESKKANREAAEKLGLKTVAIANGAFIDWVRSPYTFNLKYNVWEFTGDGNYSFASSSLRDVSLYTLRAAILAHNEPERVPRRLRVYSEKLTPNQYAEVVEKVTGQKQTKKYISRTELLAKWEEIKDQNPFFALRIAAESPAQDFSHDAHVELLNPGQKYFKPTSWEEVVKANP